MIAKTHLTFALALSSAPLCLIQSLDSAILAGFSLPLYLGGVAVGALLPDIDEPGSTIGRRFPMVSRILHQLLGHRGATHSFLFPFIIALFVGVLAHSQGIALEVALGAGIGSALHLLGDSLTRSGIPFFIPFSARFYSPLPLAWRFRTGGGVDGAIGVASAAAFGYSLLYLGGSAPNVGAILAILGL